MLLTGNVVDVKVLSCGLKGTTTGMDNNDMKEMIGKMTTNFSKLDETVLAAEKEVNNLTCRRNTLTKEVSALRKQVVNLDKQVSIDEAIASIAEEDYDRLLQENTSAATKIGQLKWQHKWHNIIEENQRSEHEENIKRLYSSSLIKLCCELENRAEGDDQEDNHADSEEVIQLQSEISEIEEKIHSLGINLPSEHDIIATENDILVLQERNEKLLDHLRCQLGYVEYYNHQTNNYLENFNINLKQ